MYIPTDVSITGPQLVKLFKGQPIQINKDGLKSCNSRCLMHPMMSKKVESARKSGKGVRIMMTPEEIMRTGPKGLKGSGMSGTGFWSDAWDWLKQKVPQVYNWTKDVAVPWVKENIIDSDLYQQKIRPKIREKLEGFAESKPYAGYTVPAIEWAGDKTGAFGVKKEKCGGAVSQKNKKPTGGSFRPN